MSSILNRREFLKFGSTMFLGLNIGALPSFRDPYLRTPYMRLGRTVYSLRYYDKPSLSGEELGFYNTDTVVRIIDERVGDLEPEHNPIWIRTDDGWLHSSYIQPVRDVLNEPVRKIPAGGMLVEVTVPYTQAWKILENERKRSYRFYYGSTHWVDYAIITSTGDIWYRIQDDRYEAAYVVFAPHLKRVTAEELTPISTDITDKKVVVDLPHQKITAYENGYPVYSARIASGYFPGDTPEGEFRIERKQPSRHMAARSEGNEFDLPGVPWVCFISWTGVSIHGTYWHNNYGTPQSHGCINLSPEAAKWIYRWTDPYVPFDEDYVGTDQGTIVEVV